MTATHCLGCSAPITGVKTCIEVGFCVAIFCARCAPLQPECAPFRPSESTMHFLRRPPCKPTA
jgi:hypothetical protein